MLEGTKCYKGYKLSILKSSAGYYLGTVNENGEPQCRLSDYFKTKEEASDKARITRDYAIEIQFCCNNDIRNCVSQG